MRSWRTVNNNRRRLSARQVGDGWDMSANGGGGRGVVTIDMTKPIQFYSNDGTLVHEATAAELLGVRLG